MDQTIPNTNQPLSSDPNLHIVIRDRTSILMDLPIKSLSSVNDKGIFDILDRHANFITLIKEKLILRFKDGKEQEMQIDEGVLKIKGNQIKIYLGIKT